MKKLSITLFLSLFLIQCMAVKSVSTTTADTSNITRTSHTSNPKLVVGIVVDQMRYDYLTKFYNKYGKGGFKRIVNGGFNLQNVHYNYIPTYTAVGHASIYTGTTPEYHGIISNSWYDKYLKKSIYCVDDSNFKTIGAPSGGSKSPHRLQTSTITDQLKLAQNMQGKSIGIAIKDRSSILPAGHSANAAYWFEGGDVGKFITSTYYLNKLPKWVDDFNEQDIADDYLNETWDTYYPIETYTETGKDNNRYEGLFSGKDTPTFPYNLAKLRKFNSNYSLIKSTPAGNSLTTDFAIAAIKGEGLGMSKKHTDFLSISYSSPDYIGHQFGTNSKEIEDTYIRLDKELERLLLFLDKQVGIENYTVFLTADHAAVEVPNYLIDNKIPGGYFYYENFKAYLNNVTVKHFNSDNLIENVSNFQIFLNESELNSLELSKNHVAQIIAEEAIHFPKVYKTVTANTLKNTNFTSGILNRLQNGYNQKFSGDVMVIPNPAIIPYSKTGTTHGSGFSYDTHVPLIFYGNGIKKGASASYYPIIDIAPTLANILKITEPNGSTGKVIIEVLK